MVVSVYLYLLLSVMLFIVFNVGKGKFLIVLKMLVVFLIYVISFFWGLVKVGKNLKMLVLIMKWFLLLVNIMFLIFEFVVNFFNVKV